MFCQNCGTFLEEGSKFCPNCGTPVAAPQPVRETVEPIQPTVEETVAATQPLYEQPAEPVYQEPVYQAPVVKESAAVSALSTPILIFGILGLSFACVPYINFLGIIFSAIAKGKVKKYLAEGGVLSGKAKIGSILATVGLILGIIFTVIFAIVIIAAIIGALSGNYSGSTKIYW